MSAASIHGFAAIAAAWDADQGPPVATLLSRSERSAASFATRILAHVLGRVASRSSAPLSSMPWVLGTAEASILPGPLLRRILAPARELTCVRAGVATVPMVLVEALAHLARQDAVLVAFAQDATPPYHEALAAAWLLTREPVFETSLELRPPTLRRTSTYSEPRSKRTHPLVSALRLARAIDVGQPTVETVPSCASDRPESWRIELSRAF